jgi:EAL domain-containing protein (putative c-di-GMP-specific phosphodiesterase class I)
MPGALGLETVADGVETAPQAAFLKRHGCHYAEGYLFGAPLEAEAVADFLAANQQAPI